MRAAWDCPTHVMERANVRVVQAGDGLHLALEPLLQITTTPYTSGRPLKVFTSPLSKMTNTMTCDTSSAGTTTAGMK